MFRKSSRRLQEMMKAITMTGIGENSTLQYTDVPKATIQKDTDVLIQVHAAGVNRGDISQRRGHYPAPRGVSELLGLEVSGVVAQVGSAVTKYKEGDKVMALLAGGGYAEYAVAHHGMVLPVPQGYSFVSAAAIPESFLTAWQLLRFVGDVQEGQRVLLHAGASGLGVAASQLTEKYFRATAVTTSSESKVEFCKRYASVCLSRTPDESGLLFANKVRNLLGEESINCIIEPVFGGNYMKENEAVLAEKGRIIVVAYMGGARVQLNLMPLYRLRAHLFFSKLRCRSDEYKTRVVSTFEQEILPYLHERMIVPAMYKSMPLKEAAQAHQLLESNTNWGKIVLTTGAHPLGEL